MLLAVSAASAEVQFYHYNTGGRYEIRENGVNGGIGNWLILAGILIVLVGLLAKTGVLGWFGNLPGDIAIRRDGFRFYFPITSMILVSLVLSVLFSLIRRFF